MGQSITPGRTWVTGETVTAAKLNDFILASEVDSSSFEPIAGSSVNATNGDFIWIEPSKTVNLPATPNDNDEVTLAQLSGDLSSTSATVDAGSINIDFNSVNGVAADVTLTLDANFIGNLKFVYNSTNNFWKVV